MPILPGHEIITADTIEQIYLNYGSAMAFRCPSVQPVYTCASPSVRYVAIFVKLTFAQQPCCLTTDVRYNLGLDGTTFYLPYYILLTPVFSACTFPETNGQLSYTSTIFYVILSFHPTSVSGLASIAAEEYLPALIRKYIKLIGMLI